MNHYVCDRCGHSWQESHVIRCPECHGSVVNVWIGDGAAANAKAQSMRISCERRKVASPKWSVPF